MQRNNFTPAQNEQSSRWNWHPTIGAVFFVFIILQFYFSWPILEALGMNHGDILYIETVASYVMITLSLFLFGTSQLKVFGDHFTLSTIVAGCFLSIFFNTDRTGSTLILVGLGILLISYMVRNRKIIKLPGVKYIFIAIGWSVLAVLLIAISYGLVDQTLTGPFPSNLSSIFLTTFFRDLIFTSIPEEASFRGLIFGFLVMNGYREDRAFLIQALLFWGMHLGSILVAPALFVVVIPLSTIVLTLVIRKYRLLYMSIMVHAFINTFTTAIVVLINLNIF
jgi:membrane protease YdiL (CAAX protease family)